MVYFVNKQAHNYLKKEEQQFIVSLEPISQINVYSTVNS